MQVFNDERAEGAPEAGFSPRRLGFGLAREPDKRVEIALALRGGGVLTVFTEVPDEVTAESLDAFTQELAEGVSAGARRFFADTWSASGQRTWVNMAEVVAFSVRQAK